MSDGDDSSMTVGYPSSAAMAHVGSLRAIPTVLRSLGADPAQVFASARVDPALFDDADSALSFAARGRLIRQCVSATGCAHFGLLIGQRTKLDDLGLVGLLVKYSPDVGTAPDYADASAFTRAFRRWSGTTPAEWRAQAGRGFAMLGIDGGHGVVGPCGVWPDNRAAATTVPLDDRHEQPQPVAPGERAA
jgi:hypothetical protein